MQRAKVFWMSERPGLSKFCFPPPPPPPPGPGTTRISRLPSASPARRASRTSVFCPGLDRTEFPLEPKVLATEEDLVLIRIIVSSKQDIYQDTDYYIYQAADRSAGGGPSLKLLPRPPQSYAFESHNVGILRCGTSHQNWLSLRPRRDTTDDDFNVIAGLCTARNPKQGQFILCHYNSKVPTRWSTDSACVTLNKQLLIQHGGFFHHANSKVIALGGDAGTMAFVDLWRGILFCDVLKFIEGGKSIPPLGYVALPTTKHLPDLVSRGDAHLCRDIAVVEEEQGRMIKYVELQVQLKPGQGFQDSYAIDGWVSRTWKIPVSATYLDHSWVPDCQRELSLICVDKTPDFELLPKVLDSEGRPLRQFKELDVCQPTLSLNNDDGTVYFMVKKNCEDDKAWVIAVDMRENTLQGVSEFAAERTVYVTFAYVHSRISKYLRNAPGTKGTLKRHGTVLPGSSSKRHLGLSMLDCDIARLTDAEMEDFRMELD